MSLTDMSLLSGITVDGRFAAMMMVVFLAGIVRGFTGFGSALLAVPALALLFGPVQAVVIEVLIEVPVSLGLLATTARQARARTIAPMLMMFALFVPVGALLLTMANPDYVKVLISLFVLCAVTLIWRQPRAQRMISPRASYIVGAISGTTQGLIGMAGPLFATALLARGDSGVTTRANISALAAGVILFSVLSFWALGLLTVELALYALLASPAMLAGVWAGAVLFARVGRRKLRAVILCVLALTAVFTLVETLI